MDQDPKSNTAVLLEIHVEHIKEIVITIANVQVALFVEVIIAAHLLVGDMLIVACQGQGVQLVAQEDQDPKSKTAVLLKAHVVQIKGIVTTIANVRVALFVEETIAGPLLLGGMLIVVHRALQLLLHHLLPLVVSISRKRGIS